MPSHVGHSTQPFVLRILAYFSSEMPACFVLDLLDGFVMFVLQGGLELLMSLLSLPSSSVTGMCHLILSISTSF